MSIEADYLVTFGPTTATFGAGVDPDEYKVGDRFRDMTVIAKPVDGMRVCATRDPKMCKICVESGWATKLNCEVPLKD